MSEPDVPTSPEPAPSAGPSKRRRRPGRALAVLAVVVVALVAGVAVVGGFTRTEGGYVAVIRNGGPFDDKNIRQDPLPAGSARTWTGFYSTAHTYPATQRYYSITGDPGRGDRSGVDVENLPTSDGVEVGVEGIVYFALSTDAAALNDFDDRFGTRTYRGTDGQQYFPWEGDLGWSAFLDNVVRPEISNSLREQIGSVRCVDLQAACVLVQNGSAAAAAADPTKVRAVVDPNAGTKNNETIVKVQDAVNRVLTANLRDTLGGAFIRDVKFNLVKTTLPVELQKAITDVQSAFARVSEAQARVASATADAEANRQRQRGYADCPACASIDTLKAIPPTVTTFAPGSGFAITPR